MARVGTYLVAAAPVLGGVVVAQKVAQFGWSMPPMVPVFMALLTIAAALAWFGRVRAAWIPTAVAGILIVPFGLSTGFMLLPVLLGFLGMVIVTAKREAPVAPS